MIPLPSSSTLFPYTTLFRSYSELKDYLDALVDRFERVDFIDADPIAVPHGFDDPRDREVIGLYAAILAWGRRQTILDKMAELRSEERRVGKEGRARWTAERKMYTCERNVR